MNLYQKIKSMLANPNMFHVWGVYFLTNIFACGFELIDTYDKGVTIFVSGIIAWMCGVGVECLDGYYGTKQLDETGIEGNSFSTKDLLYDAIGAVLGMITIGIIIL